MTSSARSDVGRVRVSNQDSGFCGHYLFIVADGMGGHAGGDVASGIAVRDLAELDRKFDTVEAGRDALVNSLLRINGKLSRVVDQQPELAGLGTTVSVALRVGARFVIAHIGDSRIYRLGDDGFEQVTRDHTFVQQLIDSGRITEDEAREHPRRAVLMRVLGDVDADPEIDTSEFPAVTDEWMLLCSDGLTSVVEDSVIRSVLSTTIDPSAATARLVDLALANGAPDNVTVIVVKVDEPNLDTRRIFVGSAASKRKLPTVATGSTPAPTPSRQKTRSVPVSTSELPLPPQKKPESVGVDPEDEARQHRIRRRITAIIVALIVIGVMISGAVAGYRWTQTRYYVGVDRGLVTAFQGVPVTLGGVSLSRVFQRSTVTVSSLSPFEQSQVTQTISFDNATDALDALNRLTGDE